MCNTAQDVWNSLIITHQGNKQVKDNKIDLFVQKYEEFIISDDESIDCIFSRFNTIITYLKALNESFSSNNHVRKFLRALPTKWHPKVTTIEDSKDLSTVSLDELIRNLKVYEVVLEKDLKVSKNKKQKYKSLALKARQVLSEEDASSSDSNDEEYAMAVRDFKKFFRRRGKFVRQPYDDKKNFRKAKEDKKEKEDRRCFKCDDPNHFINDCPKHFFGNQKAFVVGFRFRIDSKIFNKRSFCDNMESLNPQVVAAAKLPILNPNEFDLLKMRIEQYFLMTDYSLWEVILNGDSPPPTRIVDGVVQIVAPTTAEQRLVKKNKLKARGTLLMGLPDKHQLKFNIHKDAKSLMEAIEKRFGEWKTQTLIWRNKADLEEQSLDDLFNNLKIYEAEVKGSSTSIQNIQNIAFVSSNNTDSTNESVNAALSFSAAKGFTLLNVDSLSDAVIYSFFTSQSNSPQLDNEDLKQIDPDDLEEMDLKWQMAMLTIRAKRFLKKIGRYLGNADHQGTTGTKKLLDELSYWSTPGLSSSSGSDNEVAHCSKAYSKAYATLQTHYENLTVEYRKSQLNVIPYKIGLESVEARLVVHQQNETVFEEDIKLLKLDVMLRDNTLAKLRKKFEKAKKEKNDLKLTLEKFQNSSKNLSKLLESQVSDKTGLGFYSQVFNCQVSDSKELHSQESDTRVAEKQENDKYKIGEGYHVVPPLYTRNFLPPKPDLVFTDDTNASESVANVINVELSKHNSSKDKSKTHRHDAPIIEDWISEFEDETEIESVPKQREPSFVKSTEHGNPQQALQDKCVIDSGCSRHMTGNISFLSEFEEIDGGYVAFGWNFKECVVLSSGYKLPDENHVLLRVPRENNMYNVDLKNTRLIL
nr:zf-CCHC domain-containing protein/UBN2 domain-containing protein [Tanacetum cinerariifolium]